MKLEIPQILNSNGNVSCSPAPKCQNYELKQRNTRFISKSNFMFYPLPLKNLYTLSLSAVENSYFHQKMFPTFLLKPFIKKCLRIVMWIMVIICISVKDLPGEFSSCLPI